LILRKIAVLLIILFILQAVSSYPALASDSFEGLIARAAILAEKDSGLVLFEENMHVRHPADSLTVIMTLLLAAQAVENDVISDHELITMTESAWHDIGEGSSTQNIEPGEVMTFIDLMYSAYIGNSSEACNMIALRLGGTITSFVAMMNELAVVIGAENTRFVNPHGKYNESQYTTAYDQYLIFSEAMRNALFAEVASTFRHATEGIDDTESRVLTSSNALMNQSSRYYYRHSISGRESATFEGGYSLITFAEEDGLALVSVILGSNVHIFDDESTDIRSYSETLRLLQWGYTNFAWRDVLKTTELLARVPVLHGSGADSVNARPEKPLSLLLNNAVPTDAFIRDITIFSEVNDEPLVAPIEAGTLLGEVVISRDGIIYARTNLVANTDISLSGVEYIRGQIRVLLASAAARTVMLILGGLLVIYILLVIRYNIVRANRLRRIKEAKSDLIKERQQNFRE
jgi:D-alanyl-D-alanine carboxypeptidase (penicillin-binding protein 5/6)